MNKSKFLDGDLACYASKYTIPSGMVGAISDDRSAVVGKNNWCFIYEGSNNYRNGYIEKSLITLGDEWSHVIEARQHFCDNLGVKFLQVIIPNKLTLIPEYFPEKLKVDISYVLRGIINAEVNANVLIPVSEFRAGYIRETVFRRNDSHLTISGNAYLTELILNSLDLMNFETVSIETNVVSHVGDLGVKFPNKLPEELHAPLWTTGLFNQRGVGKTKDIEPAGLNGIEQAFVNPGAPIKKKIMVIGNSFFERVPSWGLSPFFSSLFNEYYFMWSPSFNARKIEEYLPDIIVVQTCERFLTKLPVDVF